MKVRYGNRKTVNEITAEYQFETYVRSYESFVKAGMIDPREMSLFDRVFSEARSITLVEGKEEFKKLVNMILDYEYIEK